MELFLIEYIFRILILDGILAVGSKDSHAHSEFFDFEMGEWLTIDDYPFANGSFVSNYDMLYVDTPLKAFFIIGGKNIDDRLGEIAKYQNGCWSSAGQLNSPRQVSFFLKFFFCIIIYNL